MAKLLDGGEEGKDWRALGALLGYKEVFSYPLSLYSSKDQMRYLVILLIYNSDDADVDVEVRMEEFGDSLNPSVLLLSDW